MPKTTAAVVAAIMAFAVVMASISPAHSHASNNNNNGNNGNNAKNIVPASCLKAATTLCSTQDTNALRCLRKLVLKSDFRIPSSCSEAILATRVTPQQRRSAVRVENLRRLVTEGASACNAGNNCQSQGAGTGVSHNFCNDVGGKVMLPQPSR